MKKTTVYSASGSYTTAIRTMTGPIEKASMWNTITNVLRRMNFRWLCLATCNDEYFITADNKVFVLRG